MLNSKKLIALSMAACLAAGTLPALAEGSNSIPTDAVTSATQSVQCGGMREIPGGRNGQPGGQQPGEDSRQQRPDMPTQGQQPAQNQQPTQGQRPIMMPAGEQPSDGDDRQLRPGFPADGQKPDANGSQSQQPPEKSADRQMPGMNGQKLPQMPADGQGPDANDSQNSQSQQPPEKPTDGQGPDANGSQDSQSQQPPEMPTDDQMPGGMPGQMPGMNGSQDSQSQQPPEMPADGQMPGGMPGQMPGGMGNDAPSDYAAANTVSADSDGASYNSESDSENAVLVSGESVTLTGAIVSKTGDTNGENADFYGVNAAVLAVDGATLTIEGASVNSDGAHANGVFSYGSGTTVNVSDTTITTTGNNSGGLMTTGGATLNAENVTVSTSGNSSAAIRSDRGGGTVNVNAGSYGTSGVGSPAIYSTADITVSNAALYATNSEAVVIEGGNSVTLNDVDITGSDATLNGQSTQKTNVLIYQSMSGDASEGSSSFTMTGGSMTAETGSMFHVTNVTTTIELTGVTLNSAADSDTFLSATADSWGRSGSNGGHATVNLSAQTVSGDIVVDEVSSVALSLKNGSSYTGAIIADGSASVTLETGSSWILTGDSSIDSLDGDLSGIDLNGYTLTVGGVAYEG